MILHDIINSLSSILGGGKLVSPLPQPNQQSSSPNMVSPTPAYKGPMPQAGMNVYDQGSGFYFPRANKASQPSLPTATPSPRPTLSPTPQASPTPDMRPLPTGTQASMDYFKTQLPNGQTQNQAFPLLGNDQFTKGVQDADKLRPGLANLLMQQAFHESTLGRLAPNNPFGVKINGRTANFNTPQEALQYQLGPNMLGGGANPNMNILKTNAPLTANDVSTLYNSYNPDKDYLQKLLNVLFAQNNPNSQYEAKK